MRFVLAFPLAAILAVSQPAAVPDQNRSQFRGRTDLVRLDVSVLDAARRPIRGLAPQDFSVLDNGVEYPVVAMTEFDIPAASTVGEPWLRDVAPDVATNTLADGRLFIIVLDDALMSASARSLATSKEAARAVIERLGPSDVAAVVYSNDGRKSQNFTSDKAKLLSAVDKLTPGFFGTRSGGGFGGDAFSDEVYMRASIATLRQVAEVLASGPERRKALVYIGEGVPLDMTQATTPIGPAPGSNLLSGAVFMPVLIQEFQKLIRAAQRANAADRAASGPWTSMCACPAPPSARGPAISARRTRTPRRPSTRRRCLPRRLRACCRWGRCPCACRSRRFQYRARKRSRSSSQRP